MRHDLDGLLPGQVAGSVHSVDTLLHENAAAQIVAQPPVVPWQREADVCSHELRHAEHTLECQALHLPIARIELQTVGDCQKFAGVGARLDHGLALLARNRHRFFYEHVLTGLRGTDRKLGVQRVRNSDENEVDVGIVRNVLEVVVGVLTSNGNAEAGSNVFQLFDTAA